MSTSRINLDHTQYVRINTGLNPMLIEALNGDVHIVVTENQPAITNQAAHKLTDRQRLQITPDTNIWALADTKVVQAVVTEEINGGIGHTNYYENVVRGLVQGHRIIHKFGHGTVGTTPTPITPSGFWRTPTTATALEFVSDDINDATGGTGATKITIQGIGADWTETTEEIATNGTTAVPIPTSLLRLHRWYVSESGSYANETTASHAGTLTIRESGAGQTWDIIDGSAPFAGQSEIGVATIPTGYTGYILAKNIFTDSSKYADVYLLQRQAADDVTTPYTGTRRILERDIGVSGGYNLQYVSPKGPYVGPCDIGFMANVATGTDDVSVDFEILIIEDGY